MLKRSFTKREANTEDNNSLNSSHNFNIKNNVRINQCFPSVSEDSMRKSRKTSLTKGSSKLT